ncbi:GntP family permease [Calidifontibacillus oryziterrae]|uniref:GntP family permease n=1 Tax=Calidifontibacillus oryziterrae TaxID=1191699 RepID=UPI0002F2776B|nr:SLC13 family permease [Calidifontibacillus oryziterrae]
MGVDIQVSSFGTIAGLIIAIVFILKRVAPPVAMMIGALVGGLMGGLAFSDSVNIMIDGAKGMTGIVLRVLTAGVLAGVLIESGAAKTIAESILHKLGVKKALLAIAGATMILTAVGVFIGVAVLTVAPIALSIAKQAKLSKLAVLLAISGGGKAGNIMSPNPNTIAVSEAFSVPLTSVMVAGIIPALLGLAITYLMAQNLKQTGSQVEEVDMEEGNEEKLPSLFGALSGPAVAIFLLLLQPGFGISIDPLIALPVGGIAGAIVMKKTRDLNFYITSGIDKMSGIAILLLGTGTLAGLISHSALTTVITNSIESLGLPTYLIAPIAGITMSAATGSTSAAAAVAGGAFAPTIIEIGVSALAGAAMVHAGATVLDHMPHGTYFHITRSSVKMNMHERFKLLPYETVIGIVMVIASTIMFGILH